MSIKIETDANGCEMILLTDVARFGAGGRGLPVKNILVRACDGAVFAAPPSLHGLSRLGEAEAEMVAHYFREVGGPHEPNVFVGDTPPDG